MRDFPGGTVDRNLPANAGDTGSIPGLKFHKLRSNEALAPQLLSPHLSPCTTTTKPTGCNY